MHKFKVTVPEYDVVDEDNTAMLLQEKCKEYLNTFIVYKDKAILKQIIEHSDLDMLKYIVTLAKTVMSEKFNVDWKE